MSCRFRARQEVGATAVRVGDMHWIDLPAAHGREQRGRYPEWFCRMTTLAATYPLSLSYR